MRGIVLEWMFEVCFKWELRIATYFLSVQLLDLIVASMPVSKEKLQLMESVAMLLASNIIEYYSPTLEDFVRSSDKSFIRKDLITEERHVIESLNGNLLIATVFDYYQQLVALKTPLFDSRRTKEQNIQLFNLVGIYFSLKVYSSKPQDLAKHIANTTKLLEFPKEYRRYEKVIKKLLSV